MRNGRKLWHYLKATLSKEIFVFFKLCKIFSFFEKKDPGKKFPPFFDKFQKIKTPFEMVRNSKIANLFNRNYTHKPSSICNVGMIETE